MRNVFRNDRMIALRKERGLSTIELAKTIGVAQQTITKWENGQANPSRDKVSKLSDFFDTSMDYLMGNSDEKNSDKKLQEISTKRNRINLLVDLNNKLNFLDDEQIYILLTIAKSFAKK